MIKKSLLEIKKICKGRGLLPSFENLQAKGVSIDSRSIKEDQIFIALVGENDGHDYVQDAINNGARAIIASKSLNIDFPIIYVDNTLDALQNLAKFYLEELAPKVILISGSNGKTSTKDILAKILSSQYKTHKTKGNLNNYLGLPLTILSMEEDVEVAVLEVGIDHFGEMDKLSSLINPDIGVITNAGEAHLDDLKTVENVAKAKMEFLNHLKNEKTYLYFKDDPELDKLAQNINSDINVISYGEAKDSDFKISNIKVNPEGSSFNLDKVSHKQFSIPLIGKHQIYNTSVALAVAHYLNISEENMHKSLKDIEISSMRMELKKANNFTIMDDSYKSNPASLKAALESFYSLEGYSQKIAVIGDMLGIGDNIEDFHREIGKIIREDKVDIIVGIGYYSEYIIWEAEDRFSKDRLYHFEEKPENISEFFKKIIKDNSLILVKASRPLELDSVVKDLLEIR